MPEQTIPTAPAASSPHPDETAARPCLVSSHAMPLPATFSFQCFGARFDAAIRKSDAAGAHLIVRCELGHMPFSAESATLRRYLHALVDAGTGLPMAEITLDRRQAIVLRGEMSFPEHPSPAVTAAGTAAIAIAVKPVVEIIQTCQMAGGQTN